MTQQTDTLYEPWTPVQAEQAVHSLGRQSSEIPAQLKAARLAVDNAKRVLTSAKAALKLAAAKLTLSPECPTVGRAPDGVTVADRDAWVLLRTVAEQEAVADAEADVAVAAAVYDAIEDQRKSIREQLFAATAINASVREAYRGSNR